MADHLTDKECREISCLAQLREALGDPLGRLMQDELVQLARDVVAERDRLRAQVELQADSIQSFMEQSERRKECADRLRADVRELVECLTVAHRVIGQDWEDADGVPLREWHETSGALLAKHNPLQALADNAREMGLSYEGESDEHQTQ